MSETRLLLSCRLQLALVSATLAYPVGRERSGWLQVRQGEKGGITGMWLTSPQPVRSTHSLEAPLACGGAVITSPEVGCV